MTAKVKISIDVYDDDDVLLFHEPRIDTFIGIPDITEYNLGSEIRLAPASTNVEFSIDPINSPSLIYILTDETISVKKNSTGATADDIPAFKIGSSDKKWGFRAQTSNGITSLFFGNAGTNIATVRIIILSQ